MIFKAGNGSAFLLSAMGEKPLFLACVNVDTLTQAGGALDTLIRCFRPDGGWRIIGHTLTAPDPVTTSLELLVPGSPTLERALKAPPFGLLLTQRTTGRLDDPGNYDRAWLVCGARAELSASGLKAREEVTPSTITATITAIPPVVEAKSVTYANLGVDAVAVSVSGKVGIMGLAPDGGLSPVLTTQDGGKTWQWSGVPFGADEAIASVGVIQLDRDLYRLFAVCATTASRPLTIATSDDWGLTWTTESVGSVTGQVGAGPHALHAYGYGAIWLAATDGYVYRSADGGNNWTTVHNGTLTSEDLTAIHVVDGLVAVAVGNGDAILITEDGGESWSLASTGTGDDLTAVAALAEDFYLVGTDGGELWLYDLSEWVQLHFSGESSGAVRDVAFIDGCPYAIVAIHHNTTSRLLRSLDGGFTWQVIATGADFDALASGGAVVAGSATLAAPPAVTPPVVEPLFSFDFSLARNSFYIPI